MLFQCGLCVNNPPLYCHVDTERSLGGRRRGGGAGCLGALGEVAPASILRARTPTPTPTAIGEVVPASTLRARTPTPPTPTAIVGMACVLTVTAAAKLTATTVIIATTTPTTATVATTTACVCL